ncbi:MAG: YbaN family protein [Gemmataceae bacterium]
MMYTVGMSDVPIPEVRTGLRRYLYIAAGLFFVGVGILGALLPVLPTTPWLLLASFCFARSSPRLHAWLRTTPYFGKLIQDWETHRGVRPRVKASAITIVVLVVGSTVLFSRAPDWAKLSAAGLASIGVAIILFVVPTLWAIPAPNVSCPNDSDAVATPTDTASERPPGAHNALD